MVEISDQFSKAQFHTVNSVFCLLQYSSAGFNFIQFISAV